MSEYHELSEFVAKRDQLFYSHIGEVWGWLHDNEIEFNEFRTLTPDGPLDKVTIGVEIPNDDQWALFRLRWASCNGF